MAHYTLVKIALGVMMFVTQFVGAGCQGLGV